MARFRGTIRGQRGSASRLGSAKSGLTVEANGWDVGVNVSANNHIGSDRFLVYATGGSRKGHLSKLVGYVELQNGVPTFIPTVQS